MMEPNSGVVMGFRANTMRIPAHPSTSVEWGSII